MEAGFLPYAGGDAAHTFNHSSLFEANVYAHQVQASVAYSGQRSRIPAFPRLSDLYLLTFHHYVQPTRPLVSQPGKQRGSTVRHLRLRPRLFVCRSVCLSARHLELQMGSD